MENITGYMKAHPWATGIIVVVGGFIFIMVSGVFSGGGSSSSNNAGPSDAQIQADATVQAAQIAAQGAAQQAGAAIQSAQLGASVQMHSDDLSAQVAMRQLEVQQALGLDQGVTTRFGFDRQLEAQKSSDATALGIEQSRDHVQVATNSSNNKGSNVKGIVGTIGGIIGSIFSDQRLKENIVYVGKNRNGFNVYRFNYKGSETVRQGVIAQDVERSHPELVYNDPQTGYKRVSISATGGVS